MPNTGSGRLGEQLTAEYLEEKAGAEPEFRCQFERLGYFVADRRDHVPGRRPVFNRTVALKDSWAKKQK